MKVVVYFEAMVGAHTVAHFDTEETYMACLPALEGLAKSKGYIVTESVGEEALTETDNEDFALVAEYEEAQHALELEDYDQFNRDNTDPITKITGQTDKL